MEPFRQDHTSKRFFVGTNCHVLCIDQATGETVWQTELHKSINSRLVTVLIHQQLIFASCFRTVACLEQATGETRWKTSIKKLGEPAALALDTSVPEGQLIVGATGRVYSLSATTGGRTWTNELPGLGYHPICQRVPGAIVAQPISNYITNGKSTYPQVLENDQLTEDLTG